MALDRAPNSPQANQPLVNSDRTPTLATNTRMEEIWRQIVAGFVIVPCIASGTANAIVLTPRLHEEGAANLGDGMAWSFTAALTSAGAVTASIGDLPAKKVYTNSGALQAGASVIVAGSTYILMYESALDAGNGGFVAFGSLDLSAIYQPLDADLTALAANGFATQADMEAETAAKTVTSDMQHFGPSAAKCWAYVTVSAGTPTLAASYNITSITDTATGRLTVTIATDFSSANWVSELSADNSGAPRTLACTSKAAGSVELDSYTVAPALADPDAWNFAGFGDQ